MGVVTRVVKPKSKKTKRFLEDRAPKAIENTKATMLVRGKKCSNMVQRCFKDLHQLKKPLSTTMNKKNDIRPFEDATSLEFFSRKLDAALFAFGSHNKKRPNNVVFGRLHDYNILDMAEFGLDAFTPMEEFKIGKVALGSKPCLLFSGESFADTSNTEMQRVKSLLIDFFRGAEVENVRLAGVEHVLQFTALDNKIFMRSYKINLKKSGGRIPRVELSEIGPSIDMTLRRTHLASEDLMRSACKQVANVRGKKKVKNIEQDAFGSKLGRVHIVPQQISTIQTRKVRALKESKEEKLEAIEKKKEKAENARKRAVETVFGADDDDDDDEN